MILSPVTSYKQIIQSFKLFDLDMFINQYFSTNVQWSSHRVNIPRPNNGEPIQDNKIQQAETLPSFIPLFLISFMPLDQ